MGSWLLHPFLATTARVLDVQMGLGKGRGNWKDKKRDPFPPSLPFLFLPATQPAALPLSNLYLNTLSSNQMVETFSRTCKL